MFILELVQTLEQHKVKYAIVGGYAVALHGAVRGTIDVDIVVQLNKSAFRKAEMALLELGLKPRLPLSSEDVFNFREEYIRNKNLTAWSFVNADKPTDMVDIIITEDLNKIKTVIKTLGGKKIQIASIDDLIRMKSKTGRKQDIEDVKALKELQ